MYLCFDLARIFVTFLTKMTIDPFIRSVTKNYYGKTLTEIAFF